LSLGLQPVILLGVLASVHTHTHTHGSLVKTEEEYTYSNYPVLSDCLIPYSRLLPGKLTVAELLQKTPTFYIVNLAIP